MVELNGRIAEDIVLTYLEDPLRDEDPYYRNVQKKLKDIQETAVYYVLSIYVYGFWSFEAEKLSDILPRDVRAIAYQQFQDQYGGRPRENAPHTRNQTAFDLLREFYSTQMQSELEAYNILARYGMNEPYTEYTGKKNNGELEAIKAKRRKEALWMKALEHEAREQKAFESSLSYRLSKFISYACVFLALSGVSFTLYQKQAELIEYVFYFILMLGLLTKKKIPRILFTLFLLYALFANGLQSFLQIFILMLYGLFVEAHQFEGRHFYHLIEKQRSGKA